jgi:hypothetical protein
MNLFTRAQDAKEFLIARIAEEAQREGIPLSEVERKMLYFSETAWTLPDIWEVNEAFDREYDNDAYEAKVVRLIQGAHKRATEASTRQMWDDAINILSREDHYLLVLIEQANGSPPVLIDTDGSESGTERRLKFWFIVAVIVLAAVGGVVTAAVPELNEKIGFYFWATALATAIGYFLYTRLGNRW